MIKLRVTINLKETVHSFDTKKEAREFVDKMHRKYNAYITVVPKKKVA